MQENNPGEINLKRIWALVLKRRYTAIAVGLAVLSLCTWGALVWPKTYEASSTVFVERGFRMGTLVKETGVNESMDDRLRVLKSALTSRNIVDRVVKKLDLDTRTKGGAQYEGLVDGIINKLDVKISTSKEKWNPDLFEISYRGGDPKTVRDLVNTLVSEYIEENSGFKRNEASGTYEFIQGQLAEYKKKLEDSDIAVREFLEKNPGADTANDASLTAQADMLDTARADAEVRLTEARNRRENLQKQLAEEKKTGALRGGPQARLDELNKQLLVLTAKYTDDYPEVKKVKGEIEEVNKQIATGAFAKTQPQGEDAIAMNPAYSQLRQQLSSAEGEEAAYRAKVQELARQQGRTRGKLGRIPKGQEEWSRLQRDRLAYQRIYDDLVQKLGSAGVSRDLENANKGGSFRVVDPAVLPYLPVWPNTVLMIMLGIALGIASGVGAAVIGIIAMLQAYVFTGAIPIPPLK